MLQENEEGWLTRERAQAIAVTAIAATLAYLCWLLVEPLMGSIAWALALAVVAHPLHAWLLRRVKWQSVAAALATLLVAVALVLPATLAGRQVAREAVAAATKVQGAVTDGRVKEFVERNARIGAAYLWLSEVVDLQEQLGKLSEHVPKAVQQFVSGSLQFAVGVAVAFFLLFFFLRDRAQMLDALRGLLPLSADETAQIYRRVDNTIHAIIYGTLVVSLVQGALGALMFWWLDLHAPLLWGSAMAVMAIVPVVGTAIIWGPAAVFLLVEGSPEKALILGVMDRAPSEAGDGSHPKLSTAHVCKQWCVRAQAEEWNQCGAPSEGAVAIAVVLGFGRRRRVEHTPASLVFLCSRALSIETVAGVTPAPSAN